MKTMNNCLEELLDETTESAMKREKELFDISVDYDFSSLILFGAGRLGLEILLTLRKLGISPKAFADNNPKLWGNNINGLYVFSPEEAVKTYGQNAPFLVTIRHPGFSFEQIRQQLQELNCKKIVPIFALYWKYPEIFLPHYFIDLPHKIIEDADNIRNSYNLFTEEYSQNEFVNQLRYRLFLQQVQPQVQKPENQYFPDDLDISLTGSIFVDCGAFDGDTIKKYINNTKSDFVHIYAFEPDPSNYRNLTKFKNQLLLDLQSKITTKQAAVGRRDGIVNFDANGNEGSAISLSTGIKVESLSLDNYFEKIPVSYIKMDIEGAEQDAILGAENLIKNSMPILAICVYHRPNDLWRIPFIINYLSKEYDLFLRSYDFDGWDLICYAIPNRKMKIT